MLYNFNCKFNYILIIYFSYNNKHIIYNILLRFFFLDQFEHVYMLIYMYTHTHTHTHIYIYIKKIYIYILKDYFRHTRKELI